MRKIGILLSLLVISFSASAQFSGGIKAGVNFAHAGKLKLNSLPSTTELRNNMGFHVGLFGEFPIKVIGAYVGAELLYQHMTIGISNPEEGYTKMRINRFDVPIHFGFSFLKFFKAYAGPVLAFNIDNSVRGRDYSGSLYGATLALTGNVGFRIDIVKFVIDARYQFRANGQDVRVVHNAGGGERQFLTQGLPGNFGISLGYKF